MRERVREEQELNSSETSCDKDKRYRSKFFITGKGKENKLKADYTKQSKQFQHVWNMFR
jgi:hypothetical protein